MTRFFQKSVRQEDDGIVKTTVVSIKETDLERSLCTYIERRDKEGNLIYRSEAVERLSSMATEATDFILFKQKVICDQVNTGKLNTIKIKYNGLCEIISNYVLLEDLLGKNDPLPLTSDVQSEPHSTASSLELWLKFRNNTDFQKKFKNKYGEKITLETLKRVEDTHILQVTNFFTRLIGFFFSIYPCNLFSNSPFSKAPYHCTKVSG